MDSLKNISLSMAKFVVICAGVGAGLGLALGLCVGVITLIGRALGMDT